MTTDDTDLGGLSSLTDPQGQVQAGKPELDDHGAPVRHRSARSYLPEGACLASGTACFALMLTDYNGYGMHKLAGYPLALAFLLGMLGTVLGVVLNEGKYKYYGGAGKRTAGIGFALAIFGMIGLIGLTWPVPGWAGP